MTAMPLSAESLRIGCKPAIASTLFQGASCQNKTETQTCIEKTQKNNNRSIQDELYCLIWNVERIGFEPMRFDDCALAGYNAKRE